MMKEKENVYLCDRQERAFFWAFLSLTIGPDALSLGLLEEEILIM